MAKVEPQAEWESSRVSEPIDFPTILFSKLATLLEAPLGSTPRHRHLQDLQDLLAAYQDDDFEADMKKAGEARDLGYKKARNDGIVTVNEKSEILDEHQRSWLAALMRLMKRRRFLGEEWVRG